MLLKGGGDHKHGACVHVRVMDLKQDLAKKQVFAYGGAKNVCVAATKSMGGANYIKKDNAI